MTTFSNTILSGGMIKKINEAPVWSTGAALPAETVGDTANIQLTATDIDDFDVGTNEFTIITNDGRANASGGNYIYLALT